MSKEKVTEVIEEVGNASSEKEQRNKQIKLVCTTKYDSTVLKRRVDVGEILTKVSEERAQVLIKAGVADKA